MKSLKLLICLICLSVASSWASELTTAQQKAQRELYMYLDKEKFNPSIDTTDNSVCFKKNDILYWITFSENSPILYTFNRKGYKIGNKENDYKKSAAITAANEINRRHNLVKVIVGDKKVDMAIQAYAETPEDFIAVFKRSYEMFNGIDDEFKTEYEIAREREIAAANKMEEEMRKNLPPSELEDFVESVSFRVVDENDREIIPYDKTLRKSSTRFIQAMITFLPWESQSASFDIRVVVTGPNGKPICQPGTKYTLEKEIVLNKSKKPQEVELSKFGSTEEGYWKAGEYKVTFIQGGQIFYETSFTLL